MQRQDIRHHNDFTKDISMSARCKRCQKTFNTDKSLQQHIAASSRHNLCSCCSPSKDFQHIKSLEKHVAAVHRSNDIRHLGIASGTGCYGLEGIPRFFIEQVFRAACSLRHQNPQPHTIVTLTKTSLDLSIVSAIIAAALRLLPPDNSPAGRQLRREREKLSAERAGHAEADFAARVAVTGLEFVTEPEQKLLAATTPPYGLQCVLGPTPDLLLKSPVLVSGHFCFWIEFKNDFGFRSSPFVTSSTKKQVCRYLDKFGPGILVYKLGFESGLFAMPGLVCMREAEALERLKR